VIWVMPSASTAPIIGSASRACQPARGVDGGTAADPDRDIALRLYTRSESGAARHRAEDLSSERRVPP